MLKKTKQNLPHIFVSNSVGIGQIFLTAPSLSICRCFDAMLSSAVALPLRAHSNAEHHLEDIDYYLGGGYVMEMVPVCLPIEQKAALGL